MDEETILDFFCYDEALYPGITCPACGIGRLASLDDAGHHICEVCDTEYMVTDGE